MPREIQDPKMKAFFDQALEHLAASPKTATAIKQGTPEWSAWGAYLIDRVGYLPVAMKMVEKGQLESATMPAQWPHWFDPMARQDLRPYRSPMKSHDPSPAERDRVEAGFASLKRELASLNLSMRNPKPLPEDRITRAPGAISERLAAYVPPRSDWTPGPPLDKSLLASLPSGKPRP